VFGVMHVFDGAQPDEQHTQRDFAQYGNHDVSVTCRGIRVTRG
jgi:hypothetical protein